MSCNTTCDCCGAQTNCEPIDRPWHFVTIQKADGHEIDGYFITDDSMLVKAFAHQVNPLPVCESIHPSIEVAENFAVEHFADFLEIQINYAK